MTADRQLLIERFLDGSLAAEELAELRQQLERDEALRRELAEAMRMAGLVEGAARPPEEYERLARTVLMAVASSRKKGRFSSQVMRRLPGSRRQTGRRAGPPWRLLTVAAALLIGLGAYLLLGPRRSRPAWEARIVSVQGPAELQRGDTTVAAGEGAALQPGDRLAVGAAGLAVLRYAGEATEIGLHGDCRLSLSDEGGAKRLVLERGRLKARAAPQPRGRPMVLLTPHARAEVVGTSFSLEAAADRTRLEVEQGAVRLSKADDPAAAVLVEGGRFAVAAPGAALVVAELVPPTQPPAKAAFRREFDAPAPGEWTPNERVRLPGPGGEVTAIASRPRPAGAGDWKPDEHIELCGRDAADGAGLLYEVPEGIEIRFRIRSEKPGKCYFSQQRLNPATREESLSSENFDVGPEWREVVLRAGDLKPYRRPDVHTPDMAPGMKIGGITFYGFGAGRLFVDRIEVAAAAGAGAGR